MNAPQFSVLTPQGRGAVATIAIWGTGVRATVHELFRSRGRPLVAADDDAVVYGEWRHAAGSEDVVISVSADELEVHCHGGTAAVAAICQALTAAGLANASTEQWLNRQQPAPLEAAAEHRLASALTERTAGILLDQHQGAFEDALRKVERDPRDGVEILSRLVELSDVGMHLTEPWRVVLAGPPNVGKSSLINRLLGFERAIVFDRPGTTRDVLTATTAVDGWPVELADTAGFRDSSDELEQEGVARARRTVQQADLVLHIRDARDAADDREWDFAELDRQAATLVLNKSDLIDSPPPSDALLVSAMTGEGVAELWQWISTRLVPAPPAEGEAVPFLTEQIPLLHEALRHLKAGSEQQAIQSLRAMLS